MKCDFPPPNVIPEHGWARWTVDGFELLSRKPFWFLCPGVTAFVWGLCGNALGGFVARVTGSESVGTITAWTLLVVGAHNAILVGISLARACDEMDTFSAALRRAVRPWSVVGMCWTSAVQIAVIVAIGALVIPSENLAGSASMFDLLDQAALSVERSATYMKGVAVTSAAYDLLNAVSPTVLAAVAATLIIALSGFGITVIPSVISESRQDPISTHIQSLRGAAKNVRQGGLIWWAFAPSVGIASYLITTVIPTPLHAPLVLAVVLVAWVGPVLYVANREIWGGVYQNLPYGYRAASGRLIEGSLRKPLD